MKKLLLYVFATIFMFSCTSLDDVEKRLDNLEQDVLVLQQAYESGKIITKVKPVTTGSGGWEITFSDDTQITLVNGLLDGVEESGGFVTFTLTDGTSFKFKMESETVEPRLLSMMISASDNAYLLVNNARCEVIGDSVVECWVDHLMNSKNLIARFEYEGDKVSIDDVSVISGETVIDYKQPVKMLVHSGDKTKGYTVYVHAFTGLPVLWIETEGHQDITSKDYYLRAHARLVEDVRTRSAGDVIEDSLGIKGRGNSTWGMPKKPYRLKLDNKQALLGEPKDKSSVLLNNYADKSMLRTQIAFYMGRISNLDYTPSSHFVELMLNGRYNGTYLLCDKLKIDKNRVNVGDDGFLLEVDAKAASEDVTFRVNHIGQPLNIKEPDDITVNDEKYNYIKDYLTQVDAVLFSDNFTDADEGWRKYIDMDSFVDWYLINEIAKNNDAVFYTSCYMNLARGGKLKMGPLWDFDIAFGNVNYNNNFDATGFWIKGVSWISRMFQDPVFVSRVKERFNYFYSKQEDIMREINENAEYLRYAAQENEGKWHTFYTYTWPNYDIWGNYNNEVQQMKEWINARFEWLKGEIDKM